MSNVYYQGEEILLYAKFNNDNEYLDYAQVRILHDKNGEVYEDLEWTDMKHLGGNEYYLNYTFPFDSDLGQYQVVYIAKKDDKDAYIMETIHVVNNHESFINVIKIYGYVNDIKSNLNLVDCKIIIENLDNNTIYESNTNHDGYWESYIYPGNYKFIFKKHGYDIQELMVQIGDEHNEIQFDNIGLENESNKKKGNGMFSISDSLVLNNGQPLVGLNVSVYKSNNPIKAIAEDVTNEDGEWECYLDSGNYLLKIKGTSLGKPFDKTLRLKVDKMGIAKFEDLSRNSTDMKPTEYISSGDGLIEVSDEFLDKFGNPIVDVQVNALDPKNQNNILAQTYSDLNGKWKLNLNPGTYTLEYYHPKFKTITEKRTIN